MSPFAALLERHRLRADLSMNELAHAIGCDPSYISRLIRDARQPPRRVVVADLCRALALNDDDADALLVAAGYAPWWLTSATDLRRLRAIATRLQTLANLLDGLGVTPTAAEVRRVG